MNEPEITPLGDNALLVRVARDVGSDSEATINAVLRARDAIEAAELPEVVELSTAYTTVAVFLRTTSGDADGSLLEGVEEKIRVALQSAPSSAIQANQTIDIPVCYDAEFAPDLEEVSRHSGLEPREVIRAHCAATYRVSCVGFSPGFPYLSGLPPQLAMPRRATPRTRVPAGSVAIGGAQAGVYPHDSPGGWNLIGRTPLKLFDPLRTPPALLRVGDQVRFREIDRAEFDQCR